MKKTNQNFNRSARSFKQLIKELRAALADEYKFEKSIPLKIIDAIEQSKDLDVQAGVGIARQSLLDFAADQRCPKVAALLLENGADPNARGLFEYTPIMTATFRNCFDIVKLLVDNGAIVNVTSPSRSGSRLQRLMNVFSLITITTRELSNCWRMKYPEIQKKTWRNGKNSFLRIRASASKNGSTSA